MPRRVDTQGSALKGVHVKARTGVTDCNRKRRRIDFYPAENRLGTVVLAAVEYGIGQRFLKRDENIDLFRIRESALLDKVHDRFARSDYRVQIPRESKLSESGWLLHGLADFRQSGSFDYALIARSARVANGAGSTSCSPSTGSTHPPI
jgi:hypothetical protein